MWLWPSSCCRPSPFSVVRPDGAAQQEAARAHVARRPAQVADALEAEHRIEDVERDHRHVVVGVRRRRRRSTTHMPPASLIPSCRIWPFLSSL